MGWGTTFTFLFLFIGEVRSESIYTTVFNIVESKKTNKVLVLSGADGRVYKTLNTKRNLKKLYSMIGKIVRIDFSYEDEDTVIDQIKVVANGEVNQRTMDLNHFQYNQLRLFAPTDLKDIKVASDIFNNMLNDGDKAISQCYKRAHMWSFDMWAQQGILSEKIFIFYTRRYIDLEEFDWWFHVAPMVTVGGEKFVMDGTFMTKPIPLKEWKDYFIKTSKITCPMIKKYPEFENNQWSRLCYLMTVPMYYYDPISIEDRDVRNELRNHWVLSELQLARRAFWNWANIYEALNTARN
jgi:hypothetical protein